MRSLLFLGVLLLWPAVWNVGFVHADAVDVENGRIFIADGGLRVLNLSDGEPAACADTLTPVERAVGVEVEGGKAVVTVETDSGIDVEILDVSACLGESQEPEEPVDVSECVATIDLDEGVIEIPCLHLNGVVYTLTMNQRGSSSNWEVGLVDENETLLNYRHPEDDSEDDGEGDSEDDGEGDSEDDGEDGSGDDGEDDSEDDGEIVEDGSEEGSR